MIPVKRRFAHRTVIFGLMEVHTSLKRLKIQTYVSQMISDTAHANTA